MLKMALPAVISLIVLVAMLSGCATSPPTPAAPVTDPLRIGNPKAAFVVTLQAERDPLPSGDAPQLGLQATAAGYMNLYFINAADNAGQLLTNYPVQANEPIRFPPTANKKLRSALKPPPDTKTFILVVTRQPLNLLGRRDIKNVKKPRTVIAELNLSGPQLVNRLRDVLRRWPPPAWNADSVQLPHRLEVGARL